MQPITLEFLIVEPGKLLKADKQNQDQQQHSVAVLNCEFLENHWSDLRLYNHHFLSTELHSKSWLTEQLFAPGNTFSQMNGVVLGG